MSARLNLAAGSSPGSRLRDLVLERDAVLAPGVFDGLSAALTESAGVRAAYMSGAAVAASAVGLPDIGLATQTEMAAQAALISRLLTVPLIADADTGFGDVTNTIRTVQLYEQAGVAGIQLEDQEFPKRCGHLDGKAVIPADEFATKIEAACATRRNPEIVVVARTDSRADLGFEEAIRRLNLYVEAGADMVFLEAPLTADEALAVPGRVKAPAIFNLVPGGKTPSIPLSALRQAGYAVVILPGLNVGSAVNAMKAALTRALAGDLDTGDQAAPRSLFDAVGLYAWEQLRGRYGAPAAIDDSTERADALRG